MTEFCWNEPLALLLAEPLYGIFSIKGPGSEDLPVRQGFLCEDEDTKTVPRLQDRISKRSRERQSRMCEEDQGSSGVSSCS